MQRRDFSRSLLAAGTTALAATGGLVTPAFAQRVGPKEGTDFVRLNPAAPVESPASQVEVVEFFAYSCIHCFNFEPMFDEWMKKQPASVNVRRMPVAFSPAFVPMQRLYFTLENMKLVERLHSKVFQAIHVDRLQLTNTPAITAWIEKQGGVDMAPPPAWPPRPPSCRRPTRSKARRRWAWRVVTTSTVRARARWWWPMR